MLSVNFEKIVPLQQYSNFENFVRHLPPNSPTLEQSFITIKELRCIFLIPVLFLFRTTNSAQSEINKNSKTKKVTVFHFHFHFTNSEIEGRSGFWISNVQANGPPLIKERSSLSSIFLQENTPDKKYQISNENQFYDRNPLKIIRNKKIKP